MPTRPDLFMQYQLLHAQKKFLGFQTPKYVDEIKQLIDLTNAKTLLDYGCGQGRQYTERRIHKEWGNILPRLYDPYYEPFSGVPGGQFDGVICTDVAEHIPEDDVDDFLKELNAYAKKFIFMSIDTKPAKKELPDGRNAHLTVREPEWWRAKQNRYIKGKLLKTVFV